MTSPPSTRVATGITKNFRWGEGPLLVAVGSVSNTPRGRAIAAPDAATHSSRGA
jgi:hypothetical protein